MTAIDAIVKGNIAVVTGAADGIGLAASTRFARLGLNVCMIDNNQEALEQAAKDKIEPLCSQNKMNVLTIPADISNLESVQAAHEQIKKRFGKINVLMNNAGIALPSKDWELLDNWHKILEVNLWGILNGIHTFVPDMIEQDSVGIIINTGSKQGITSPPGNPAYNVSKAAVKAVTESLQHSLRNLENTHVSSHLLIPGFTYTGMIKKIIPQKPESAWEPSQVIDYMLDKLKENAFYIICPDNEVSQEMDQKRIEWAAHDLIDGRPPLSRWHKDYQADFNEFML